MTDGAAPRAHHRPGGGFRNPWDDAELRGFGSFLKWKLAGRRARSRPAPPAHFPVVPSGFARPRGPADRLGLTWVGHSTFLVQLGGLNLVTDPMWSARASPIGFLGPRRLVPPAFPLDLLPPLDVVLISHNHYDHLDAPTVRRIARAHPAAQWVAPLGLGPWLRGHGAAAVSELDWWEELSIGGLRVGCTPAQHFSARGFRDRNATLWAGFAVASGARRLFFAGDTARHPVFATIAERFGPFDAACLPIGAYDPRWFMQAVHMDPEEALAAYTALERPGAATLFVAMHWGTFRLTDEPPGEPPVRLRAAWQAAGRDPAGLWVPAHGETRSL